MLTNKNILLGVTGSIAAYKAAIIVRLFQKKEANVKVVMTPLAQEFITQNTLSALSGYSVHTAFFKAEGGEWNSHVELGSWADVFLIAPATANTIAKMASGIADNLLLATYLAATKNVFIAPAMDLTMYAHPATKQNIKKLKDINVHVIEPASGYMASGLEGKGRMQEPEEIVEQIVSFLST